MVKLFDIFPLETVHLLFGWDYCSGSALVSFYFSSLSNPSNRVFSQNALCVGENGKRPHKGSQTSTEGDGEGKSVWVVRIKATGIKKKKKEGKK